MSSQNLHEILTVMIQTSPIPSHPSTALLEALFTSIQKYATPLVEARILILADGCETLDSTQTENMKHGQVSTERAQRYQEHLRILKSKVQTQDYPFSPLARGTIEVVQLAYKHGSARGIRAALFATKGSFLGVLAPITTPLLMVGQHDNFFVSGAVPMRSLLQSFYQTPGLGIGIHCLHFLSTSTLDYPNKIQRRYGLRIEPKSVLLDNGHSYNLIPLVFWYGRTHLSTTQYFRNVIFQDKCPRLTSKDHLEELLGEAQLADIREQGMDAHAKYGTYVLQTVLENGQEQEILYHLSGRRAVAATCPPDGGEVTIAVLADQQEQSLTSSASAEGPSKSNKTVHGSSYTTARACRAIVPGLTILNETDDSSSLENLAAPTTNHKMRKKKFKQRCFHCGEKGHSFKFCPLNHPHKQAHQESTGMMMIRTETVDLS